MRIFKFTLKFLGLILISYFVTRILIFILVCFDLYNFRSHIENGNKKDLINYYEDKKVKIYRSKASRFAFFYPGPDKNFCYVEIVNQGHYIFPGGNVTWVKRLYKDSENIEEFKKSISKMRNFYRDGYFLFCISYIADF